MPAVAALVSHGPAYGPWTRQRTGAQVRGVLDLDQRNTESAPEAMRGELGGVFLSMENATLEGSGSMSWRGAGETDRQTRWCHLSRLSHS